MLLYDSDTFKNPSRKVYMLGAKTHFNFENDTIANLSFSVHFATVLVSKQ